VPRHRLTSLMDEIRRDFLEDPANLIYGSIRKVYLRTRHVRLPEGARPLDAWQAARQTTKRRWPLRSRFHNWSLSYGQLLGSALKFSNLIICQSWGA
jgi:hypothetical protein